MAVYVMNKHVPGFISGDWIFATLIALLRGHELENASLFLDGLDVQLIQPYVLLGIIQITRPWKTWLGNRKAFFDNARQRLIQVWDGDEARVDDMLRASVTGFVERQLKRSEQIEYIERCNRRARLQGEELLHNPKDDLDRLWNDPWAFHEVMHAYAHEWWKSPIPIDSL